MYESKRTAQELVTQLREDGFRPVEIAELCGVDGATVWRWWQGRGCSGPARVLLELLCDDRVNTLANLDPAARIIRHSLRCSG